MGKDDGSDGRSCEVSAVHWCADVFKYPGVGVGGTIASSVKNENERDQ